MNHRKSLRLVALPLGAVALLLSCSAGGFSRDALTVGSAVANESASPAPDGRSIDTAAFEPTIGSKTVLPSDPIPEIHASRVETTRPASTEPALPEPHSGQSPSVEFSAREAAPFECALDGAVFAECTAPPVGRINTLGDEGPTTTTEDPTLTINDVTTPEGDTGTVNAVFTVALSAASASTVTVVYTTSDNTAAAGSDYETAVGTLIFEPGDTSESISVPVNGDVDSESDESFLVDLSAPTNATLADSQGVGTITDDDTTPSLSIGDVTVTEGDTGTTNAVFTATLSATTTDTVTVDYATANQTASAGSDYVAASGTLTFTAGDTSETVAVTVNGDVTDEAHETFTVGLSNAVNAGITDESGVGTITDDDSAPQIAVDNRTVVEGAGTDFTVSLSHPSSGTVMVDYASANGTAMAPADYTSVGGQLSFAPGQTSKTVTVSTAGDLLDEFDESFVVGLSNASTNATIADDAGLGTITDDDAEPSLSVNDVTVTEGNAGTVAATFAVTLAPVSGRPVTVNYATANDDATAGSDYAAASGTLNFAAGETTKTVTVAVDGDELDEANENFFLNLTNSVDATLSDAQGVGTITDDDALPQLSINDVTVDEGTSATFTVTLAPASGRLVTVGFATANDSAAAGSDYVATSGTLSFSPGETVEQVTVPVNDDALDEAAESFAVNLSGAVDATLGDSQGVAAITDNDPPPTLSINDVSASESGGNVTFTVSLSAPSSRQVSVTYATANGSATAPADYTTTSGGLTFTAGETAKTFSVPVNGDALDEDDETFTVTLSGAVNATIADGEGRGTILDDDPSPALSINDVTVTEGDAGTTNATFTVTLSAISGRTVTVDYATADGSATAPADYATTGGTLTFAAGEVTKQVSVPVNGDVVDEGTETYLLILSNAPKAVIADDRGAGTIIDDDGEPSLSINDVTVLEGDAGSVSATFTVSLSSTSGQTVSVGYSTENRSATASADYEATGGSLVFTPGQGTRTVTVQVNGDLLDEINEDFVVNLSAPVNATIADGTGFGTITDNDLPPHLLAADTTANEGDSGTATMTFTVSLDQPSGRPVTVSYETEDNNATAPADYLALAPATLTFAPGETTKSVAATIKGDVLDETNETFVLKLSNATNASFTDSVGAGTIMDDDPLPQFSIGDATVTEGNDGTVDAHFTVTLAPVSGRQVTVQYTTTASGSATAGADYAATSGVLTFAAGETVKTVPVAVIGDLLDEVDETFTVSLSAASPAGIADGVGTGTITDDDAPPQLSVDDVTVVEGDSGTVSATFAVSLAPASGRQVTVQYATANGFATAPADYTATTGGLTFAAGDTVKTVTVPVKGDVLDEDNETFSVGLASPTDATIADGVGTGTITDDDALPALSIGDATVTEGNAGTVNASFTVTLAPVSGRPVTVGYATTPGTAAAPADFQAVSGQLTFMPGETTKTIIVPVNGDLLDEIDETFTVELSGAVDATVADAFGLGTIIDNDPLPQLSVNDVTLTEGDSGTVNADFTVSLNAPSGRALSVEYATESQSAAPAADYVTTSGTLTFVAGTTTQTVSVPVVGDVLDELDETFLVKLANPSDAAIADGTGVGTITDNDPLPALSINDVTVTEGDSGTANATFTVSLSAVSGRTVTVNYGTINGTAVAPSDFAATSGPLAFAPGETARTIAVPVNGDTVDEANETFAVTLSGAAGATTADPEGAGTIIDDDASPALSVNDVSVTEGNASSVNATFTVTLGAATAQTVRVDYATVDGSASAPADYAALPLTTLTFTPGQTTRTVTVQVAGDALDEIDETFTLNLSNAENAAISDAFGLGTIVDNDPPPELAISDATVIEGNLGTVNATFTVSLDVPSAKAVTVDYATANGAALTPDDYLAAAGTLNFAPGETAKTVAVTVNGDTLDEANETFTVGLSNPGEATIADGTGTGTITDDDPLPLVSIGDATVTEGNSGTVNATFTVTMSPVSGRTVTVNYATANDSAVAPADYTAASGQLSFAPGETSKTITVAVTGDALDEFDETFLVNLPSATDVAIADGQGVGTIMDDDAAPSLSVNDVTVTEGQSGVVNANFTVTLSAPSAKQVSVGYATADGMATSGADYEATSGTVIFTPGTTTRPVTVRVTSDTLDELDESFTVGLSAAVDATIGDEAGLGTIIDDDAPPSLSVSDVTVVEGNSGTVAATFTVSLNAPSGLGVSADYATADGMASAPADYTAASGRLSFVAGETAKQVTVTVKGDTLDEANETFTVNLANAANATIGDAAGTGTIEDDDPLPALAIDDVTVIDGNSGTANATFTVSLSTASGRTVTANFATNNGSATAPADYTATTGVVSFAPGDTVETITVPVHGDLLDEVDETFTVNLTSPVAATLADASGQGTITDDDPTPTLSINDVTVAEGHSGTVAANFTVSLNAPSGRNVTVNYATANGTALSGSDYQARSGTVTFTPGQTSQQLTILVNGDTLAEASETYVVKLSAPVDATLADDEGAGTIIDDDGEPVLTINDVTVTEGQSGTVNANFTVTLSAASGQTVSVGYATADDTAAAGADYTTGGGNVVFNPGVTTRPFTVEVKGDTLDEVDERFFVNLSGSVNAEIADGQGVGTITDDDAPPTLAVTDVTVAEGHLGTVPATFTVSLNAASGKPVTVGYATGNGTAVAPADYAAANGTLDFAAGQTTKSVAVQVAGDTLSEINETFTLELANPTNATIVDTSGLGTITDDDPLAALSINDVTVTETDGGSVEAVFTVSLNPVSGRPVTVNYATTNGAALAPGDYATTSGALSFAPGETSKTVTVPVNGDLLDEDNETFTVTLAAAAGATLADPNGVGTITDNDAMPALSVNDVTVTEGDAGTTAANFTVSLSAPSGRNSTVNFATTNGTAIAPADYQARPSTTLTFVAGETAKTVTVLVNGETVDEPNETYSLRLSTPTSATIADEEGVGTIVDDDGQPSVSISDVTIVEGNSGTANANFTVTLSGTSGQTVSVGYATADDTATSSSDYTATGGNVVFGPGVTSQTLTVQVTSDLIDEIDERLLVNLSGAINATIADNQGVATITDDDDPPTMSIADATVTEGNSGPANTTFTVTLSRASGKPITVDYATADETATAPSDYAATSSTLSFAAGQTTRTFTVAANGDLLDEDNETYRVNLTNATNATIADPEGRGTITDDDALPTATVNDVVVAEGDAGTATATFTVTLGTPSGRTVFVDYATVDGATVDGAAVAPSDYAATGGTLAFTPGQTAKTVNVAVNGDTLDEFNETFTLNLSSAVNVNVTDGTGLGTITDDDPLSALSINDATVTEGNSGTVAASFTVGLSAPSAKAVSVNYATANDTAIAPSDYAAASGTLNFAAGQTAKTFTVTVNGDVTDELDETFKVNLSSEVNATITDPQGIGRITDDDGAASLSIGDVTVTEGDTGTKTATFNVTLSPASGQPASVHFATVEGSATAPADYTSTSGTLNFAPGDTTETVSVLVNGDVLDEIDESFTVALTNSTNAAIGDGFGLGTIADNDPMPSVTVTDTSVTEGDTGTATATFTVALNAPSGRTAFVDYATTNGSASAPADYLAAAGTLNFTPGQTTKTVAVTVNADTLDEENETFTLNLANASNATIGDATGIGTITDDDPLPVLSIDDVTVTEGDAGTVNATFTVTLSTVSGRTVGVGYVTANGQATAPADYTAASGALSFTPGETTKTITVAVNGDALDEDAETFTVNLAGAVGAAIVDGRGTGTITDDDALPTLSVNDVTVTEGNTGTVAANFTVSLSAPSGRSVMVTFATANGTATTPSDYQARSSSTLTFPAGETARTVTVLVNGDTLDEVTETYSLNLSAPTNAIVVDDKGGGTIIDDDGLPTLVINDVTVTEGNSGTANANFTVTLTSASGQTISVGYSAADGTATFGSDYSAPLGSGSLVFTPGQTTRTVTVPVTSDTLDEFDETFFLNISEPVNAEIGDDQGTGTITDDDAPPALSVADFSVAEGNTGTVAATFAVRLSAPSSKNVTVEYATSNGTATAPVDYAASTGSLAFDPGQVEKTVTVLVNGDALNELNETFTVNLTTLTTPGNATVGDATGIGTILNDDPLPALSIGDVAIAEGNVGTSAATFTVTLDAVSSRTVTVDYATANRSAITPEDYEAVSGMLTFEPGETTKTVPVPVHGDVGYEADENFVVNLSNVVAGSTSDNQAVGTITNDDAAPPPPPGPPPPPPPPPPAPDTTAPAEVTNVRVKKGDETITLSWANPSDPDFQRVTVTRIAAGKTVQNLSVYDGGGKTFTDRGLKNGAQYRYRIRTHDRAGNASAGVAVAALPQGPLFAPAKGAIVTAPPLLRWVSFPRATYYNAQLYLVRRSGQAHALAATKILSVWPTGTRYKLRKTWRFGGKRYRLVPGKYRWYVWPGLGKRSANKYGPPLGDSTFTVKAPAKKKR